MKANFASSAPLGEGNGKGSQYAAIFMGKAFESTLIDLRPEFSAAVPAEVGGEGERAEVKWLQHMIGGKGGEP